MVKSSAVLGPKRKAVNAAKRKDAWAGLLFSLPWIVGFLLFSLYPIGVSVYYSLTEFNIFQFPKWVGLGNYTTLFQDPKFYTSLINTFYMVIIGTPVTLIASLLLAVILNQNLSCRPIFRTVFYLPSIVPAVASSLLWIWILNPQYGLFNSVLKVFGIYQPNWLVDPSFTKPALIIMAVWGTGQTMIVFLAALQDVPRSLYEAAEMDGAGTIRKFFSITIPSITPVIFFQLIMSIIAYFQYFTQAYILINNSGSGSGLNGVSGGPENSLLFYSLYLWHNAFGYFKMGYASAMAWVLFIIIMIVTLILFKTQKRWVTYGDE